MSADDEETREIMYSDKYTDDTHEYRHVTLPKCIASQMPKDRLLTEDEWRNLGVCQSLGWVHYMIHRPEPHILLFRRPLNTDPRTGKPISTSNKQGNKRHGMKLRHHYGGSEENDARHGNERDHDDDDTDEDELEDECMD